MNLPTILKFHVYTNETDKYDYRRFLWISGHLIAQPAPDFTIERHGDLYVFYNTDNTVRVIAARNNGNVLDTTLAQLPGNLTQITR